MDLIAFNELFDGRSIYRIPIYQRGFAWERKQLADLWKDLKGIENQEEHYAGVITLEKCNKSDFSNKDKWLVNEFDQYFIVDGQQRITSFLILLRCILEEARKSNSNLKALGTKTFDEIDKKYFSISLENQGSSFIFSYDERDSSYEYFIKEIFGIKDSPLDINKITRYIKNIEQAKTFYLERIKSETDLNNIYTKLTCQFKINKYIIEKLSPFIVFETMNNRGKPLTDLERLKNRLIFLVHKLHKVSDHLKKDAETKIKDVWGIVYDNLGKILENSQNLDDIFLRDHWIMYFGEYGRSESKEYAKFLLDKYFDIANISDDSESPIDKINLKNINTYIASLSKAIQSWIWMYNLNTIPETKRDIKNALESLSRLEIKSSFRPILTAAFLTYKDEEIVQIISLLEELHFKVFDISDRQSNAGDNKLYRLAYDIYLKNIKYKDAVDKIKEHINVYYRFDLFKNQIDELFDNGRGDGFYRWSGLKYFLYEYNNWEMRKNNVNDNHLKVNWEYLSKDYESVEHIFPKTCTRSKNEYLIQKGKNETISNRELKYNELWKKWDTFSIYKENKENLKRLNGSLGNLLPLSSGKNSSLQADSFVEKIDQSTKGDEYKNKGYKYGNYSEKLVANIWESHKRNWSPDEILLRGKRMMVFLLEKLGEKDFPDEKKAELLGLSFLLK